MNITTVKLHQSTKHALDEIKNQSESYDDLIGRLVSQSKESKLKKDLIEGYKQMGEQDLELLEEWAVASKEL